MKDDRYPSFIGIGAQKCASTWIHLVLKDHPEVYVPDPKEVDFFSSFYPRGYGWYLNKFRDAGSFREKGEISPSYFIDSDAPGRARRLSDSLKIILTLRDPIERAYSQHLHAKRLGYVEGGDLSFEFWMKMNPTYVEQSRYSRHIERWMQEFPQEQICIFLLEDIKADPVSESRRLYRFLGIDEHHRSMFLGKKANPSQDVRVDGVEKVLRTLGRTGRRLGMRRLVEAVKHSAPVEALRQKNRKNLREVVPPMREETVAALRETFAEDVRYVQNLLKRDSLPWKHWK